MRYCAKFASEVKVDGKKVKRDWVEFPAGSRLDLLANPVEVSIESGRVEPCLGNPAKIVPGRAFVAAVYHSVRLLSPWYFCVAVSTCVYARIAARRFVFSRRYSSVFWRR